MKIPQREQQADREIQESIKKFRAEEAGETSLS